MTLREFYNKLWDLDIQYLKEEAVFQNKEVIIKLNQSQLHLGETSQGDSISPLYRHKWYAMMKAEMPSYIAPNYVPDLYLTGAFYVGMDLEIMNGEYNIYSKDAKSDDLVLKYKDIFGLDENNIEVAKAIVTNKFIELIHSKLN